MISANRVHKTSKEAINAVPSVQPLPCFASNFSYWSIHFDIFDDVTVKTERHLDWFFRLGLVLFTAQETSLFLTTREGKVVCMVISLEKHVALFENSGWELANAMVVWHACKVVFSEAIDIFDVVLALTFIITSSFMIEIKDKAVLVT